VDRVYNEYIQLCNYDKGRQFKKESSYRTCRTWADVL
jgi:hypothetical protein